MVRLLWGIKTIDIRLLRDTPKIPRAIGGDKNHGSSSSTWGQWRSYVSWLVRYTNRILSTVWCGWKRTIPVFDTTLRTP